MLNNWVESRVYKSEAKRRRERMQKEILKLSQQKREIENKLLMHEQFNLKLEEIKIQIERWKHMATTVEVELDNVQRKIQRLQDKLKITENDRLELVVQLQEKQCRIDTLTQYLIQTFRNKNSSVDRMVLEMIEIEICQELQEVRQIFTIRENVIAYLKDNHKENGDFQKYKQNGSLLICVRKQIKQFQYLLMGKLEAMSELSNNVQIRNMVLKYIQLMKQTQAIIQIQKERKGQHIVDKMQQYQNVIEQLKSQKFKANQLSLQIQNKTERIKDICKKIKLFGEITQLRSQDKGKVYHQIQQSNIKLQAAKINAKQTKKLKSQLLQLTQALQYLTSKNIQNQNINLINSPIQSLQPSSPMFQLSASHSCISHLQYNKQSLKTNTSSVTLIKSPTKNNIGSPSKYKIQMGYLTPWK